MAGDFAANRLALEGFMAPLSSGQTGQLKVRCGWRHLVARVAFDGSLSARQVVAGAGQLSAVAIAEGVDGEPTDWLMRTLDCAGELEIVKKK